MNTLLISYDLGMPETSADYQRVIEYIKDLGSWAKPLQSVWLVETATKAAQIRDDIRSITDSNDRVMVIAVSAPWATTRTIPSEVTDWMMVHIN